MKPAVVPVFCGLVLTGISAAGISHWWSVREILAAARNGAPVPVIPIPASSAESIQPVASAERPPEAPVAATKEVTAKGQVSAKTERAPARTAPIKDASTKEVSQAIASEEFYRKLITEMNELRNQNRDLRDQMAETNRDLMKLEFRVDTHSESFRPLPVSEERIETTLDEGTGVLPPLDALDLPVR